MPGYHAKLSPSSAKRWIHCPASVSLSQDVVQEETEFTAAGSLAHAIAELKARNRFALMAKRTYSAGFKKLMASPGYQSEMDAYTDTYVETLERNYMSFSSPPFVAFETSVPIGICTGECKESGEPATGTADSIMIGNGTIWITDYKNGAGVPVDAEQNPQMMLYALGALSLYTPIYGETIQTVKMTIVQPALKSVSDWSCGRDELDAWNRTVAGPAAAKALGDSPGDPNPGEWCTNAFCPIRNVCRAYRDRVLAVQAFGKKLPPLITDEEIGQALTMGADLVSWYNEIKDYALKACLDGKKIPGYKAVEGRTSRSWDDQDKAFAAFVQRGIAEAILWERNPVTVAALEKALGKKDFATIAADHVLSSPGKPTLAQENDKRPAINAAALAFKQMTQNNMEVAQ